MRCPKKNGNADDDVKDNDGYAAADYNYIYKVSTKCLQSVKFSWWSTCLWLVRHYGNALKHSRGNRYKYLLLDSE